MNIGCKLILLLILSFSVPCSGDEVSVIKNNGTAGVLENKYEKNADYDPYLKRTDSQIKGFENGLKKIIKGAVKSALPYIMDSENGPELSSKCTRAFMKYISGLTNVKLWAIKMLDSMSKIPTGVLEGTFSDFGAFDECLDVELPKKNGEIEFRGQYCAIEARPILAPMPRNLTMSKQEHAKPLDNVGEEIKKTGIAFYFLKFRLGICVPSHCSLEDMQKLAKKIADWIEMEVKIPQCYVKESVKFQPIHIVVMFVLSLLLFVCLTGSFIEYKSMTTSIEDKKLGTWREVFCCFSLISNYSRLIASSKGSEQLKALHGLKAFSMMWVIFGHTYVWLNFQLLDRPNVMPGLFNSIEFGVVLNGWLSVEPFFFLSGLLTSYVVLRILPKTKGKLNVPIYILRRYIRFTPPMLLAIGLAFFMPLISSGPFWYERVDPELKACTTHWWASLLYISNWTGMRNICLHPTWYLSADFQLHVVSAVVLFQLYRYPKLGLSFIAAVVVGCSITVGILTYNWDLPPIVLITSGNNDVIQETVDIVHMRTFTHAGPYYVGIVVGFLIVNYKDIKMNKLTKICGWSASIVLSLTSLYGTYRWNIGEPHGLLLTSIFAAVHRTTFTIGVAWVAFACATGHGGLVNKFLSSTMLVPVSRLTFMMYLMHCLVIWTRYSSLRERRLTGNYNGVYEFIANLAVTIFLSVPFYLLLEAPLSNLERLVFTRFQKAKDSSITSQKPNGHLAVDIIHSAKTSMNLNVAHSAPKPVELTSVKSLDFVENGSFVATKNKPC